VEYVIFLYTVCAVIECVNNMYLTVEDIASSPAFDTPDGAVTWKDLARISLLSIFWPASLAWKVVGSINAARDIEERRYQAELEAFRRENNREGRRNKGRKHRQSEPVSTVIDEVDVLPIGEENESYYT